MTLKGSIQRRVAEKAIAKLSSLYGTRYRHGTGLEIFYAYSGTSVDWAKERLNVKYSYDIELRPTYDGTFSQRF